MKNFAEFISRRLPDFCFLVFAAAASIGAFHGGMWGGLGIGFALILFLAVWGVERACPWPDAGVAGFALFALLAAAALNFFSVDPVLSWRKWLQLASIFLPLSLLFNAAVQKRATPPRLFMILPWIAAAGALALGLELASGGPLLHLLSNRPPLPDDLKRYELAPYNRGFSHLALLAFPLMAALRAAKRRMLLAFFCFALLAAAVFTESRATVLALLLGAAATGMALYWPRFVKGALAPLPFLFAPLPFLARMLIAAQPAWITRLPLSWRARTEIWDYLSYRIAERPLSGFGLGTTHLLPFTSPHTPLYVWLSMPAPHAHNALAELWLELGLPGLVLGLAFALFSLGLIRKLDARLVPFALGAWAAGFCLTMVAYDLWTDSLWAAFALTGFAFALLQQKTSQQAIPEA